MSAGASGPGAASLGDLLGEVSRDLSTLLRQEVELAKAEVRQSAQRAGVGAGLLGGAGVAVLMGLVFASVAVWWGIGNATGRGWAGLIVAVGWLLIGALLALVGRARVRGVRGLPQTVQTARQIPDAIKGKNGRLP